MLPTSCGGGFQRHDVRARHFGLFAVERGSLPIGYMRVVELRRGMPLDRDALPLLHHFEELDPVIRMVDGVLQKHGALMEGGRFSMHPEFCTLRLARLVVECTVAVYALGLGVPGLLGCRRHHARFYETFGFRPVLAGTRLVEDVIALYLAPSRIPGRLRSRLDRLVAEWRDRRAIVREVRDSSAVRIRRPHGVAA